jgi:poly [ADP-ribose] polymerase 2/3/4
VNNKKRPAAAGPVSAAAPKTKKAKTAAVPPVDPQCQYAASAHVLEEKGVYWTATLNLTDYSNNHNKYYKIQLVESNSNPKVYSVWTGWGRVGYSGQSKLTGFNSNLKGAKNEFEKKFVPTTFSR